MTWPVISDHRLDEFDAMELPGQQLKSANAPSQIDHCLFLDVMAASACTRMTGIIATMGPSTQDLVIMEKMMGAGMNIAMLNLNFGSRDFHIETIRMLKQAVKAYSKSICKTYPLAIAGQVAGKKIRTGRIGETYGDSVELRAGETVKLTTDETYKERCSIYTVYIDFMYFAEQIKKGSFVLIDNDTISLLVEVVSASTLTCKVERGGLLGSYKDVFVPNMIFDMPNYSEKDKIDIQMLVNSDVDIIVASYACNAPAITELRNLIGEKGKRIAVIANIQNAEGVKNFDSIMKVANGVMITRQELGSDLSPKKLVIAQKNLLARANKENCPVIVSAHVLSSMRYRTTPLRSELLDLANAVLDGADGLVLSAETAVGKYPLEAVTIMANACKEAESCMWTRHVFRNFMDHTAMPCDQVDGTSLAAVLAAHRLIAAAIVVITTTGQSAKIIAKFRPRCPIVAVTRYSMIARQMHLYRGIVPLIYEEDPDLTWNIDLERRVNFAIKWSMGRGFIRVGDPIVIVSGWRQGSGFTNTMRVVYAAEEIQV